MKAQNQIRIASILIIAIGVIHICVTPRILPILKILRLNELLSFAYMFVITGVALIFAGWLQYFVIKRVGKDSGFLKILNRTIIFICILGIGAVATMWNNPFAYIILLIALYEVYLLKLISRTI